MTLQKKLAETLNWNYIGLAAGLLSVIVTFYNINKYWEDIQKTETK